jgi:prepilin-type N-terminal cleavage/methylation domain-containing protein
VFDRESELLRLERRAAFTLVEMLIVIAIVAIIVGLAAGTLMLAPQRARIRGTEALIAKIDAKLQQRFNEFNQRRSGIRTLQCDLTLAGGDPSRAHVIAIIRSMRQEFPEMFYIDTRRGTDGIDNNGDGRADETLPPPLPPSRPEIIAGQWNPVDINGDGMLDQAFTDLPSAAVGYLRFVERIFAEQEAIAPNRFSIVHTASTARAECLYMIATSCGTDTADFNPDEIRDTDEDGLPEFVDRFGNPIQFFLWPSYYTSPKQKPGEETDSDDPGQLLTEPSWWSNTTYRTNFERLYHTLTHFAAAQPKGFRTYPLIVSAGPDGGFGFECAAAFIGDDGVMGPLDDVYRDPLRQVPSLGLLMIPGGSGSWPDVYSPVMRMTSPTVNGYGMDKDNIDNHHLRAR